MKAIQTLFLLLAFTSFSQNGIESLKVHWPEEYNWKIGSNQENDKMHFIELVPGDQSVENWKIIGTMISIKGMRNLPLDVYINMTFELTKEKAPKAKLTIIEKDETGKNHWAIFKIESSRYIGDKNTESQLYYIVQGESSFYSTFVALKEKKLKNEFVEKWIKVFKESELVYQ